MKKVLTILGVLALAILFGILFRKREGQGIGIDIKDNNGIIRKRQSAQQKDESIESQNENM